MSTKESPIPIVYEDEPIEEHTETEPFCSDMTCPCKEDQEAIAELAAQIGDGLITKQEADRFYRGQTI